MRSWPRFRLLALFPLILLWILVFTRTEFAQTFPADIQQFWNQLRTGVIAFSTGRVQANGYLNFGNTVGANGYGFRDSSGTMQVKNSGGSWSSFPVFPGTPYTIGDLFVATSPTTIGRLADVAINQVLGSGGVGVLPAYSPAPNVEGFVLTGGATFTQTGQVSAWSYSTTSNQLAIAVNGNAGLTTIGAFILRLRKGDFTSTIVPIQVPNSGSGASNLYLAQDSGTNIGIGIASTTAITPKFYLKGQTTADVVNVDNSAGTAVFTIHGDGNANSVFGSQLLVNDNTRTHNPIAALEVIGDMRFSGAVTTGNTAGGLLNYSISTGTFVLDVFGKDASTNGLWLFRSRRSDGTNSVNAATLSGAGSFVAASTIAAGGLTPAGTVGTPVVVAYGNVAAATNTGTASIATVTPTVDTTYEVGCNILVTTSTTHSFSCDVTYTDEASGSRTMVLPVVQLAGTFVTTGLITNVTGAGPYESPAMTIRAKASTAVTVRTSAGGTYTTVVYNARGVIKQVS